MGSTCVYSGLPSHVQWVRVEWVGSAIWTLSAPVPDRYIVSSCTCSVSFSTPHPQPISRLRDWKHQNAVRVSGRGQSLAPLVCAHFLLKNRPPLFLNFLSLSVLQLFLYCVEREPTWAYLQMGKVACKWPQIKHIIISPEQNPFGAAYESEAGKLKQKPEEGRFLIFCTAHGQWLGVLYIKENDISILGKGY